MALVATARRPIPSASPCAGEDSASVTRRLTLRSGDDQRMTDAWALGVAVTVTEKGGNSRLVAWASGGEIPPL